MKLGKHFLTDTSFADKIIDSLQLKENDTVLEIGGGKGILTERIVDKVKKLYVVELDKNLYNLLLTKLARYKNIEIINADFLKLNLVEDLNLNENIKIVGNIPYSITSKILEKIYNSSNIWTLCVLTLQKEVAQKLTAQVSSSYFSKLTLITNFYTNVEYLFDIKKEYFYPVPKVDSAVVRFTPNSEFSNFLNKDKFLKFIDISFKHKRKFLLNSLNLELKVDKNLIKKIFENLDIKTDLRPHQVSLNTYIKLFENLSTFIK